MPPFTPYWQGVSSDSAASTERIRATPRRSLLTAPAGTQFVLRDPAWQPSGPLPDDGPADLSRIEMIIPENPAPRPDRERARPRLPGVGTLEFPPGIDDVGSKDELHLNAGDRQDRSDQTGPDEAKPTPQATPGKPVAAAGDRVANSGPDPVAQAGDDGETRAELPATADDDALDFYRRKPGEAEIDWANRVKSGLIYSQSIRDPQQASAYRTMLHQAYLDARPQDRWKLEAHSRRETPDFYKTAETAPDSVKTYAEDYWKINEAARGRELPPALQAAYAIGPDGSIYTRWGSGDHSPIQALRSMIEESRRRDRLDEAVGGKGVIAGPVGVALEEGIPPSLHGIQHPAGLPNALMAKPAGTGRVSSGAAGNGSGQAIKEGNPGNRPKVYNPIRQGSLPEPARSMKSEISSHRAEQDAKTPDHIRQMPQKARKIRDRDESDAKFMKGFEAIVPEYFPDGMTRDEFDAIRKTAFDPDQGRYSVGETRSTLNYIRKYGDFGELEDIRRGEAGSGADFIDMSKDPPLRIDLLYDQGFPRKLITLGSAVRQLEQKVPAKMNLN